MKEQKMKKLHSILIIVDDFADDTKFVRYSKLLHGLATRGRHDAISFCLSVQKYRVLAPMVKFKFVVYLQVKECIRVNVSH